MEDDFEVDPAIAAAMGFSGFGTQPNKKRRFDPHDGFVDPDAKKQNAVSRASITGSNMLPVGEGRVLGSSGGQRLGDFGGIASVAQEAQGGNDTISELRHSPIASPTNNQIPPVDTNNATLEQLRQGVLNHSGDMVYFLPSFLEDPWAGLTPQAQ